MAEPPDDVIVTLRGVSKRFARSALALAEVDLDVRRGEILTLLGSSGSGKSTLLRLIAGLDTPTEGTMTRVPERRELGFVFQEPTLMPWTSVARNVSLPLRLRGVPAREAIPRVAAVLKQVGLADASDAFPRELSGGMRMRVSIARALVTTPSLLLMDEPFAALDELVRFRLDDDLLRLRSETGVTIVFVTHSIYEAAYLSDRIAILSKRPGRIVETIAVDAPRCRHAFRDSTNYVAQCSRISRTLAIASGAQAA